MKVYIVGWKVNMWRFVPGGLVDLKTDLKQPRFCELADVVEVSTSMVKSGIQLKKKIEFQFAFKQ
jgi:hypothetical protein